MSGLSIGASEEAILRAWLGGARPDDIARARRIRPDEVTRTLVDLCDLQRDTARRLLEAATARPVPATGQPEPLERWESWRCPTCRYVGPAGEHQADCDGQPAPVVILVIPREVS